MNSKIVYYEWEISKLAAILFGKGSIGSFERAIEAAKLLSIATNKVGFSTETIEGAKNKLKEYE